MSKFCDLRDLLNEAAVENLFATPLIRYLGYADSQIRFKDAITPVEVSQGRRTSVYRPDYILSYRGKPRVVIDAKGPNEDLMSWVGQATSYCLMLNRQYEGENPVRYFVLTSGTRTMLYEWDEGLALLDITFDEITDTNPKLVRFKELLQPSATMPRQVSATPQHRFYRRNVSDVNAVFAWCHEHIYKNDNMSQAAGFTEFVKLIFLKLLSDRSIRDTHGDLIWQESFDVPASEVRFSVCWINDREADAVSPIDALQFRQLVANLEGEIAAGTRKRIFESSAQIRLSAETVKAVVKRLENVFLLGVDIDLNGRLFETFLSATMRGKDLGQFFTPRSVVKLGTRMGAPIVSRDHVDKVVDGCCGTGGFLIDALADMWNTIDSNPAYSVSERRELRRLVANDALYGMDIGKDPNQARLARMNMYLHGDGGTSIFETDFLDKRVTSNEMEGPEVQLQSAQLRSILQNHPTGFFDLVLTNPPFAKKYLRSNPVQEAILDDYELARGQSSVKSSILFFERYHDLLKQGGRLVSVIDDGLLGGAANKAFRDFIRKKFIIEAVVSLPGDAFQRSQARVKTSFIVLKKRTSAQVDWEDQGAVFMYGCQYVGIDDPARRRTLPIDRIVRAQAVAEVDEVVRLFSDYRAGLPSVREYLVEPSRIKDRLDVKSCTAVLDRLLPQWQGDQVLTATLDQVLTPATPSDDDLVPVGQTSEEVTYLVVGYDGFARAGATVDVADLKGADLTRIRDGQIIVSHINAVNGSICVVPPEFDGFVITSEYSAYNPVVFYDPWVVWTILRSPEIRAEFLVRANGVGRTRVDWETIRGVSIPLPDESVSAAIREELSEANRLLAEVEERRARARDLAAATYGLASEEARATLRKFKPPK